MFRSVSKRLPRYTTDTLLSETKDIFIGTARLDKYIQNVLSNRWLGSYYKKIKSIDNVYACFSRTMRVPWDILQKWRVLPEY